MNKPDVGVGLFYFCFRDAHRGTEGMPTPAWDTAAFDDAIRPFLAEDPQKNHDKAFDLTTMKPTSLAVAYRVNSALAPQGEGTGAMPGLSMPRSNDP